GGLEPRLAPGRARHRGRPDRQGNAPADLAVERAWRAGDRFGPQCAGRRPARFPAALAAAAAAFRRPRPGRGPDARRRPPGRAARGVGAVGGDGLGAGMAAEAPRLRFRGAALAGSFEVLAHPELDGWHGGPVLRLVDSRPL